MYNRWTRNGTFMYLFTCKRKLNLSYRKAVKQFFRIYIRLFNRKYIVAKIEHPSLANYLYGIIGIAWLCEKMDLSLEFVFPKEDPSLFENSVLYQNHLNKNTKQKSFLINDASNYSASIARKVARTEISDEYGHKIILRLAIRQDLQHQADQWFNTHIKDNWVTVHYRGTDLYTGIKEKERQITINSYIDYLKEVIDRRCSIFVCTDQVQFIDKMQSTFSNRVYFRKIRRSIDTHALHLQHDAPYSYEYAYQQKCDALIDVLVASKASLIYTTGSQFIDITRYFNPDIKIISLDRRLKTKISKNYLPIPDEPLLHSLLNNHINMNNDILVSVIVPTYNNCDTLFLVLDSLARQSDKNFEVIIADDGSAEEYKSLITQYAKRQPYHCHHIWHEDKGFCAAAVRNLGVLNAKGEYLIFIDSDCLIRDDFIAQHRRYAEKGWFVSGKRINLSEKFTRKVISRAVSVYHWKLRHWLLPWLRKDINNIDLLLPYLPEVLFLRRRKHSPRGARTCNLAMFSKDFYAINGFDERFNNWGLEDTECVTRLLNLGIKHKRVRYSILAFHLWHLPNRNTDIDIENKNILQETICEHKTWAVNGIKKSDSQKRIA